MLKKIAATIAAFAALSATCFASGREHAEDDHGYRERAEIYGVVREMPKESRYGIWFVDERKVKVDRNTRIKEKYAPLKKGCTVEVKGIVRDGVLEANEVEVKR